MFIFFLLNDDIVDIEKIIEIFSSAFVADEFSGLSLHLSIFYIKRLQSA